MLVLIIRYGDCVVEATVVAIAAFLTVVLMAVVVQGWWHVVVDVGDNDGGDGSGCTNGRPAVVANCKGKVVVPIVRCGGWDPEIRIMVKAVALVMIIATMTTTMVVLMTIVFVVIVVVVCGCDSG